MYTPIYILKKLLSVSIISGCKKLSQQFWFSQKKSGNDPLSFYIDTEDNSTVVNPEKRVCKMHN